MPQGFCDNFCFHFILSLFIFLVYFITALLIYYLSIFHLISIFWKCKHLSVKDSELQTTIWKLHNFHDITKKQVKAGCSLPKSPPTKSLKRTRRCSAWEYLRGYSKGRDPTCLGGVFLVKEWFQTSSMKIYMWDQCLWHGKVQFSYVFYMGFMRDQETNALCLSYHRQELFLMYM